MLSQEMTPSILIVKKSGIVLPQGSGGDLAPACRLGSTEK
jgi:hypothetical protein